MIEYRPSTDLQEYLQYQEGQRYKARYVYALGRPRKRVVVGEREVRLQFDLPGALNSVPILVELAAGSLTEMAWEQVEDQPPSGWWGDLEPGSPTLYMKRRGPKVELPQGFRYSPPPFRNKSRPPPERGTRLAAELQDSGSGRLLLILAANGAGFLSIAKHLVFLGRLEIPVGTRIAYGRAEILEPGSRRIVLERAEFPKDVPWSVPPSADTPSHPGRDREPEREMANRSRLGKVS
jgi:hypothetical protein